MLWDFSHAFALIQENLILLHCLWGLEAESFLKLERFKWTEDFKNKQDTERGFVTFPQWLQMIFPLKVIRKLLIV